MGRAASGKALVTILAVLPFAAAGAAVRSGALRVEARVVHRCTVISFSTGARKPGHSRAFPGSVTSSIRDDDCRDPNLRNRDSAFAYSDDSGIAPLILSDAPKGLTTLEF